jgi:predicted ATPase
MISKIRIQNFKCLRDVTVELGPFNVLIGPNDSGKSSLLDAIQLLGRTTKVAWPSVFGGPFALEKIVWMTDPQNNIKWDITGESDDGIFEYHLELKAGKHYCKESLTSQSCTLQPMKTANPDAFEQPDSFQPKPHPASHTMQMVAGQTILNDLMRFQHDPAFDRAIAGFASTEKYHFVPDAMRQPSPLERRPVLKPTGENLVAVLDRISSRPDRRQNH